MATISHREMRNNSAEVLRRAEAGERIVVTNHGKPVAVISPVPRNGLEEARARGEVREATISFAEALKHITPVTSDISSEELLRDVRGEW